VRALARLSPVLALLSLSSCGGGGGGGGSPLPVEDGSHWFVHTVTPENNDKRSTVLSHPSLDENRTARPVVTALVGAHGNIVTDLQPVSLQYAVSSESGRGRWHLVHQSGGGLFGGVFPMGMQYVVTVGERIDSRFHASASSETGNRTIVHRFGVRESTLFVAQVSLVPEWTRLRWANYGVYYREGTWRIFDQDTTASLGGDLAFVLLGPTDDTFVHHATADTLSPDGTWTRISHPALDGNPDALLQVTQNWNADDAGVYNDHPIAAMYDFAAEQWAILQQDEALVPVGASFNVWFEE
jgi:hypothetical protein